MSRPTGRTFELRAVRDFLRVPPDRRTQCLTEFLGWLAHVEVARLRDAPTDIGPFIWADDGVGGVRDLSDEQRRQVPAREGLRLR